MDSTPIQVPAWGQPAAFLLLFRELHPGDREQRVLRCLEMVQQGDLDGEDLLGLYQGDELVGVVLYHASPGATGLVWPPQVIDGPRRQQREDLLLAHARDRLRQRGVKIAQALLIDPDRECPSLARHGFDHVTHLWYLRHILDLPAPWLAVPPRLHIQTYAECRPGVFEDTLMRTYRDTLDFPEMNDVRTVEEILAGNRAEGIHDPRRWWLAWQSGRPVGVALTSAQPEGGSWDLAYMGVVPEARRQGVARELLLTVLLEARGAGIGEVTLCVDGRNSPASKLYRRLGFEPYDRREVYLVVWRENPPPPRL
jgi:ribosomal protein S18 acetylase RimI-like enzyme